MIAGSARGIELRAPRGGGTRPTTGRLRESLFAMLESADVSFEQVLDLYAGSGALGIEALSRGDGHATFVESDARAAELIRENLRRTRLEDRGHVVVGKVGRWRPGEGARYTLVLADPPYADAPRPSATGARAVPRGQTVPKGQTSYDDAAAASAPWAPWAAVESTLQDALAPDAAVVIERDARRDAPEAVAGLPLWRDRRQGAGAVAIYRHHQEGRDALDQGPEGDDG